MSASVRCPGCRRRVRVPAGTDPARSRCSKCRTRLGPAAGDAYHLFATSAALPVPLPAEEPLSLDECEPIPAAGPPTVELPPPVKVPARVVSVHPLRGPVAAVFTPFGVFVEREADRPLLFAPVGTRAAALGRALRLEPAGGPLVVALPTARLAAAAAGFLAGTRPAPGPAEVAPAGWAAPLAGAVVLLAAVAFAGGAAVYLAVRPPPVVEPQPPPPPPAPPVEPPPAPPPQPPPPPAEPPTHFDLIGRDGVTRLPDGPAAVTALAVTPDGGETVVGYADGATWAWRLDGPAFEPPRVGPRGAGPVRRIDFAPGGDIVYLTGDAGLAVATFGAPRPAVVIPGHPAAATPDGDRVRFAAVRGEKLVVRAVPLGLAKEPPPNRVKGGILTTTPKDEILPANTRPDLPAGGATFLAWHPAGKLLAGGPDGAINAVPAGPKAAPLTRAHQAAVRAWAVGPTWPDFATGDDRGVVGVWPGKSTTPYLLKVGDAAITHLAFGPCGGELAVADAAGTVAVWNLPTKAKAFGLRRPPPAVVAYGPRADVLLLADGKGVEAWSLPELAARAGGGWP